MGEIILRFRVNAFPEEIIEGTCEGDKGESPSSSDGRIGVLHREGEDIKQEFFGVVVSKGWIVWWRFPVGEMESEMRRGVGSSGK